MKSITIPIKPISANECWKGRKFKTKKYDMWREETLWLVKAQSKSNAIKDCSIDFKFYLNSPAMDLDNMLKPIIDTLQFAGIILNDRYITKITAEKIKSKEEKIEITITPNAETY